MNKKTIPYFIVAALFLVLVGTIVYKKAHQPVPQAPAYTTSTEYLNSIDYSCKKSSDCEIKDVHNCCDKYFECVNKKAKVDPEFIVKACAQEGIGSKCGSPDINQCDCVDKKCVGVKK